MPDEFVLGAYQFSMAIARVSALHEEPALAGGYRPVLVDEALFDLAGLRQLPHGVAAKHTFQFALHATVPFADRRCIC